MKFKKNIELEIGQFYQRENGNIFRVISAIPMVSFNIKKYKIRNIRHKSNAKPYTYQSIIFNVSPNKVRRIGTEEILNILANN